MLHQNQIIHYTSNYTIHIKLYNTNQIILYTSNYTTQIKLYNLTLYEFLNLIVRVLEYYFKNLSLCMWNVLHARFKSNWIGSCYCDTYGNNSSHTNISFQESCLHRYI